MPSRWLLVVVGHQVVKNIQTLFSFLILTSLFIFIFMLLFMSLKLAFQEQIRWKFLLYDVFLLIRLPREEVHFTSYILFRISDFDWCYRQQQMIYLIHLIANVCSILKLHKTSYKIDLTSRRQVEFCQYVTMLKMDGD